MRTDGHVAGYKNMASLIPAAESWDTNSCSTDESDTE